MRPLTKLKEVYSWHNRNVRVIIVSSIPSGLATHFFSSFLPLYIKQFEARMFVISLFFSLRGVFDIFFAALSGWQVDKYNRATTLVTSTFVYGFGVLAILMKYLDPLYLVLGLLATSFATKIIGAARYSLIVDDVASEHRSSLFGLLNTIGNIFGMIGGAFGGYLLLQADFRTLFFIVFALIVLTGIVRLPLKDPKYPKPSQPKQELNLSNNIRDFVLDFGKAYRAVFGHKKLLYLIGGDVFIALAFSTTFNLYAIYFKDFLSFDYGQVGALLSFFFVGIAVSSLIGSVISDKVGHERAIVASVFMNAVLIILYINTNSFFGISIIYFLLGATGGIYAPNFFSIMGDASPEEHRGRIYSIQSINDSIFATIAPIIGGVLWDNFSPVTPWYMDLSCTTMAGLVFLGLLGDSSAKRSKEVQRGPQKGF